MDLKRHLDRIEAKLDRLLEVSGRRPVTGPVLSAKDIATFEAQRKIQLPEEYRRFLQRFGDGGPALHALAEAVALDGEPLDLSSPFPYVEPWLPVGEISGEEEMELLYGFLVLACWDYGEVFGLVLTGDAYGEMWVDERECGRGIRPVINYYEPAKRANFLDWFEQNLDVSNGLLRMDSR